MAAIGDRYEYDVFISYAWALEAVEDESLRDWCREVADGIFANLRRRFNAHGRFQAYLDRDASRPGQALGEVLKTAVERSAVFVAFISDYYQSPWCQREVGWFCDRVAAHGAELAAHIYLINVMPTSDAAWPACLKAPDGSRLLYRDFCDKKTGQPIDINALRYKAGMPNIVQPIEQASLEIGDKLDAIKIRELAKNEYANSRLPPDSPVLFFEAEARDQPCWTEYARVLEQLPNIVLPAQKPVPANELADAKTAYADCNGVVMLRSRSGDNIVPRVKRAYQDLRAINGDQLRNGRSKLPWVLLDSADEEPPPDIAPFKIRRVQARGDFASAVNKALFDA